MGNGTILFMRLDWWANRGARWKYSPSTFHTEIFEGYGIRVGERDTFFLQQFFLSGVSRFGKRDFSP